MRALVTAFSVVVLTLAAVAEPEDATKPRPELGAVRWIRDHDAGFAKAKELGKPVFLFFQEVPG